MAWGVGCSVCCGDTVDVSLELVGDCVDSGSGDCVGKLAVGVSDGVAIGVGCGWTGSGLGEGLGSGSGVDCGSGLGSGLADADSVGEVIGSLIVADKVSGDCVTGSSG